MRDLSTCYSVSGLLNVFNFTSIICGVRCGQLACVQVLSHVVVVFGFVFSVFGMELSI